ncbi:glutaredoxin-C1 isoform X2 [Vigna angularis]|uniref:glutaredoxin-C1 isoform X2 n=1 Tax=Phaseolus angularis TaxID=3914 RepID=UPI0022B4E2AB|nr:glutaredoxin-C1 isoform X2 [Vigna angularis]
MGSLLSSAKRKEQMEAALNKAKGIVSSFPVVVFSKTNCGYCKRVKDLFQQLGATYKVVELDIETLIEWTGLRTVPNVFIGGKHIGGYAVWEKHKTEQLVHLLNDAGAIVNNSAQL